MVKFYSEEDYNGKTGQPGQVKCYDCGGMYDSNVEKEAKEMGYSSVEEYLKLWWNEVSSELPWTWETLGNGYGYHGSCIFSQKQPDGGILRCKEIYGQICFDVYPPQQNESKTYKKQTIKLNETQLKKIVAESVRRVLKESAYTDILDGYKRTHALSDADWKILICGDLNDEEELYKVLDKCKANNITLNDILNDWHCSYYCTKRGCDESDIKEELSEFFL